MQHQGRLMDYPGHKGVALFQRSGAINEVIVNGRIITSTSAFEHAKRTAKRFARERKISVVIIKERRAFKLRGAH